jgi:hypothetical protein
MSGRAEMHAPITTFHHISSVVMPVLYSTSVCGFVYVCTVARFLGKKLQYQNPWTQVPRTTVSMFCNDQLTSNVFPRIWGHPYWIRPCVRTWRRAYAWLCGIWTRICYNNLVLTSKCVVTHEHDLMRKLLIVGAPIGQTDMCCRSDRCVSFTA